MGSPNCCDSGQQEREAVPIFCTACRGCVQVTKPADGCMHSSQDMCNQYLPSQSSSLSASSFWVVKPAGQGTHSALGVSVVPPVL